MKFNIAFVGLSALVGTALTKENTLSIKWCNEDDELDGPCVSTLCGSSLVASVQSYLH